MASILTYANIADAISAVEAYEQTSSGIYESFQGTMSNLTGANWNGDGSDGCMHFFNSTVTPALTEGVGSMSKAIKDILSSIQDTLLDQLDPQLGEANQNPGGTE